MKHSLLLVMLLLLTLSITHAQDAPQDSLTWMQTHKLLANDSNAEDRFGSAVSLSGTLALIGVPLDNDNGDWSGSVYLFNTETGDQLGKLLPDDGAADDRFGSSVSLSGNYALIGAVGDDDNGDWSGSAYVFDITTEQQLMKLVPDDGAADDRFGDSVSLSGNYALVGAHQDDDNGDWSGSVYVFDITTGQQLLKLLPDDGAAGDTFGESVSLSGNYALVGAPRDGENSGSAYVFDITTGDQLFKLTANDGAMDDYFGVSVSLDGNHALVGAIGEVGGVVPLNNDGSGIGAAYVFDITTGTQLVKLLPDDGVDYDVFGGPVSLSGNHALIGAFLNDDNGPDSGLVYGFDITTGAQLFKLLANDGAAGDWFGYAVALDGNRAVVGAFLNDDNGDNSGSAYVFAAVNTLDVDINDDNVVDGADVLLVLSQLGQSGQGHVADVDGDGLVTPVDAILVINRLD